MAIWISTDGQIFYGKNTEIYIPSCHISYDLSHYKIALFKNEMLQCGKCNPLWNKMTLKDKQRLEGKFEQ